MFDLFGSLDFYSYLCKLFEKSWDVLETILRALFQNQLPYKDKHNILNYQTFIGLFLKKKCCIIFAYMECIAYICITLNKTLIL